VSDWKKEVIERLRQVGLTEKQVARILDEIECQEQSIHEKLQKLHVGLDPKPIDETCIDLLPEKMEILDDFLRRDQEDAERLLKVLMFHVGLKEVIKHAPMELWLSVIQQARKEDSKEIRLEFLREKVIDAHELGSFITANMDFPYFSVDDVMTFVFGHAEKRTRGEKKLKRNPNKILTKVDVPMGGIEELLRSNEEILKILRNR
jgi:DNA-binding transcriptional MerR regulator